MSNPVHVEQMHVSKMKQGDPMCGVWNCWARPVPMCESHQQNENWTAMIFFSSRSSFVRNSQHSGSTRSSSAGWTGLVHPWGLLLFHFFCRLLVPSQKACLCVLLPIDGCESLVERLLGPATTELFDISGDADEKEQICPKLHSLQLSHAAGPGISNICQCQSETPTHPTLVFFRAVPQSSSCLP